MLLLMGPCMWSVSSIRVAWQEEYILLISSADLSHFQGLSGGGGLEVSWRAQPVVMFLVGVIVI